MNGIATAKNNDGPNWNDLGYFEQNSIVRVGWFKQIISAYERFGWDVYKLHPDMQISKILEGEVVDRGAISRLLDYGYQYGGVAFPIMMARQANFTALGEIAWWMLTAPTLRHGIGVLSAFIPLVDTQCKIEATDEADRFIIRVTYDVNDRRQLETSILIFASAFYKYVVCFHGETRLGALMSAHFNCPGLYARDLQDIFWMPVTNDPKGKALELSFDSEYVSKDNVSFDRATWEKHKRQIQSAYGAKTGYLTKADRYAQLLTMHVQNWNYQRDGKPKLDSICRQWLSAKGD